MKSNWVQLLHFSALRQPPHWVERHQSRYHIIKNIKGPGTGGWDYVTVDQLARRVYVAHATEADIFDADTLDV